jgi:hypothetical protein
LEDSLQKFSKQSDFLDAAMKHIQPEAADSTVFDALRSGISDADVELRKEEHATDSALGLRVGAWIIRSEDIPVLEAISIGAAAATAVAGPAGLTAAAVVTAVSGFATLCWKAWRKGATLSKDEVAVLGFLRVHGPLSMEDLKPMAASQIKDMTADHVELAMKSLGEVELLNGELVDLVRKDASGRWKVRPV